MSSFEAKLEHFRIPLEEIKSGTENFSAKNYVGGGGFGKVYKGKLSGSWGDGMVAIKQLNPKSHQGKQEFMNEVSMLYSYKHKNIVTFLGYCDEGGQMIIVYEYAVNGSLDTHLRDSDKMCSMPWEQRLKVCIGAAEGLEYLHSGIGADLRVIHRDIKSSNILLNEKLEAKVSDFGLAKFGPRNQPFTMLNTRVAGTDGYCDPHYFQSGELTKESDVYSFGVVLFEMLCGRLVFPKKNSNSDDDSKSLVDLVQRYNKDMLGKIIDPHIRDQIEPKSLYTFKEVAYQCLEINHKKRPQMDVVVRQLKEALDSQSKVLKEIARVGTWGTKSIGGPHNHWSFQLEKNHKMKMITIDHGNLIYSLMFTSEDGIGWLHTSNKAGGWNGGDIVSEVVFDFDEELTGISGTVGISGGTYCGYTIISSLSFLTNKKAHGPYGQATGMPFSVPWEKGSFAGFYGLAAYYIDSIGVYTKASTYQNLARIGTWGSSIGYTQNQWSFQLKRDHQLKKIAIDHGDLIYSLIVTTQDSMGGLHNSKKAGGWNGGCTVSEVTFDYNEEVISIEGTVGTHAGNKIVSSLSFVTNKNTYGPFGSAAGTVFTVPCNKGAFAGFYGLCGNFIDCIGIYLMATV